MSKIFPYTKLNQNFIWAVQTTDRLLSFQKTFFDLTDL